MTAISGLANMSSPQTNDFFAVLDVNDLTEGPTGTTKKFSFATLQSFLRGLVMTPFSSKPAAPTATSSTTLVMGGLGATFSITPKSSGLVSVSIVGQMWTTTAGVQCAVAGRFGTGTAPANGAAASGTAWGSNGTFIVTPPSTAAGVPFAFEDIVTLTPGTTYWFDLAYSTTADTSQPRFICFTAAETS